MEEFDLILSLVEKLNCKFVRFYFKNMNFKDFKMKKSEFGTMFDALHEKNKKLTQIMKQWKTDQY